MLYQRYQALCIRRDSQEPGASLELAKGAASKHRKQTLFM